MNRLHTLRSIADELSRDKRTVQSWYSAEKESRGEFGEIIQGTRYFSDEEREWLVSRYREVTAAPPKAQKVEVDVGNHSIILTSPELPQQYSLEGLRTTEAVQIEDPLAVAQQFLQVADRLLDAMDLDIQTREAKLNQTRQAKQTIATKAGELKLEQRFYQERTRQIDTALSDETASLQDALKTLQSLGKPSATDN